MAGLTASSLPNMITCTHTARSIRFRFLIHEMILKLHCFFSCMFESLGFVTLLIVFYFLECCARLLLSRRLCSHEGLWFSRLGFMNLECLFDYIC